MKRILLTIFTLLLLNINLTAQIFVSPTKNYVRGKTTINFLAQYRMGIDGMFHYYETEGLDFFSNEHSQYSRAVEGLEHFYCYDNSNNIFYYYTDNTIGFYNPNHSQYIKFMKDCMKQGNVKKVKDSEAKLLTENILKGMHEKFRRKNDSISECKRIAREKFVKDSIETAQRKMKEQEEYRKNHDWRDLSMSKHYFLQCDFCDESHFVKDYDVFAICADTLYYFQKVSDINLLGIKHFGIHYSSLTEDFKKDKNFIEYVNTWRDSIAKYNDFINNKQAAILNIVRYNEFKNKVYETAPNGFMLKWGWELNSAEGIEPYFSYFNSSKKTVKYVDLFFSVYNAVGDRCYLIYDKSNVGKIRGVGPVEPFDSGSWKWERATHYTTPDASELRIVKLVITYMDGTTKTLPRNMILFD